MLEKQHVNSCDIFGDFSYSEHWSSVATAIKPEIQSLKVFKSIFEKYNFKDNPKGQRQAYLACFYIFEIISNFEIVRTLLYPTIYKNTESDYHFVVKAANLFAFSSYGLLSFGQHCQKEEVEEYLTTSLDFFWKLITTHWANAVDPAAIQQINDLSILFRNKISDSDPDQQLSDIFLACPLISKDKVNYEKSVHLLNDYLEFYELEFIKGIKPNNDM
jgi:hypothetical protein